MALSSGFLADHFEDRLAEPDRLALEHWLRTQLEHERRGWKQTVQMSLHEVERERKKATDSFTAIQDLNTKLEGHMDELIITQNAGVYYAADMDIRDLLVSQLERNIDCILEKVRSLTEERQKCFVCLDVSGDSQSQLHFLLAERLRGSQKDAEKMAKMYADRNEKLSREVESLIKTINAQKTLETEREAQQLNEIKALTDIISRLRARIEAKRKENKSDKCIQVEGPGTRDCCIQVDLLHMKKNTDSKNRHPSPPPLPIQAVTISRTNDKHHDVIGFSWPITTLSNDVIARSTPSLPMKYSGEYADCNQISSRGLYRSLDATALDSKRTVETLRGQVVEFAERLAEAKGEVDQYEKQIAWMKTTPHMNLIKYEIDQIRNQNNQSPNYDDGFLSGTRKDILPVVYRSPDVLLLKSHLRKKHKFSPTGAANNTHRCLRCYRLYKVKDNHKKACKYHPRGKKKIEKYNGKGKLVTVAFLWECCMQATDALGCSAGEHI